MSRNPCLLPAICILLACSAVAAADASAPRPVYDKPFFPGATYDAAVPTPETILGFSLAEQAAEPEAIERCLRAWNGARGRAKLVEYARSYEGRALYYMAVTSPERWPRHASCNRCLHSSHGISSVHRRWSNGL